MEFKSFIKKLGGRILQIEDLFGRENLKISYDRLKKEKKVDQELIYFIDDVDMEDKGIFVFGHSFYNKELEEQEFKRLVGQNSINFKIYTAYHKLKKKNKKVKISDILNQIQDERKDSYVVHKYLNRILTLAYYLNWDLKKDKKDLEGDSFIEIPDRYFVRLKQRFNFDLLVPVYENDSLFMFVNNRGKLNLVFKDLEEFSKRDIDKLVIPTLKRVFAIENIDIES